VVFGRDRCGRDIAVAIWMFQRPMRFDSLSSRIRHAFIVLSGHGCA
jgi:hypothetical protein